MDVCSANLVGTYNNGNSSEISDCAYGYCNSGVDPATGGYLSDLEQDNFSVEILKILRLYKPISRFKAFWNL